MSNPYKVGDRIDCFHPDLINGVRGKEATVTAITNENRLYAYVDGASNPSSRGFSFSTKNIRPVSVEPTDDEIAALFGVKEKRDVHFLHPEARDIEFDGMAALCDWMNCLDEQPRVATESSVLPEDVTCQDCLNFMSRLAYVWQDGAADHKDYHRGTTAKVPMNPYWGDGS